MKTRAHVRTRGLSIAATVLAIWFSAWLAACNTAQSPNSQVSDIEITTQVKTKLASDVSASTLTNIEVNTTNGVVTLAGQVENEQLKASAESVAQSVPGVVRVNNNLQVDPASVAR